MNFYQFSRIVEIRTKIVSISTLTLGFLYVARVQGSIEWVDGIFVIAAALCVDMATTAFNSFFDFERKVDSKHTNRESDKVLVHEGVPPAYALLTSVVLYGLAGILGLVLVVFHGWPIFFFGIASLTVGFLYSGGPYPISRTPVGEIFAGGFLGSVLFLIVAITQNIEPGLPVFLATLPSLVHIAAILTVNNTCDLVGDTSAGRKTLSIVLGKKLSIGFIALELSFAYGLIFVTLPLTWFSVILASLGLGISLLIYRSMVVRGFSHETKGPSMGQISKSFLVFTFTYGLLILLG